MPPPRAAWRACLPTLALVVLVLVLAGCAHAQVEAVAMGGTNLCALELDTPRGARDFRVAAAANAPAVVTIASLKVARPVDEELPEFVQPLALKGTASASGNDGAEPERFLSSGFILEPDGYIATNAHVAADAIESWVLLADGRHFRANVVGYDRKSDVALLRIDATGLPTVQPAQARPVCAGEWVAAVGAPFGFNYSVSAGIVSAYPRYLSGTQVELIQTDVALNPGSSGGPLFNSRGLVVGMSSSVYSGSGFYIGVSFAIPIRRVLRVVGDLKAHGYVPAATTGARTQPMNPALAEALGLPVARGVLVFDVPPDTPARAAGLRVGDVLTGVDGRPSMSGDEIEDAISGARAGGALRLDVWRNRRPIHVSVRPVAEPPPPPVPAAAPAAPESRLGLGLMQVRGTGAVLPGLYVRGATGSALLAGIEAGDRILAINGTEVDTPEALDAALKRFPRARVVAVLVARGATTVFLAVRRIRD